ncbi:hypothetical protein [Streptosporangium sp. NBC_01756]|uniref:hypothetical protein n=1 Tax=Streptosporangium sp. NBC_01756 TaxID=2975950 RepID=UPI002DD7BDDF|nr:hypothetical protein [Streptosporangium sp. NBC_01756]WSC88824.1 hypothetical protein OIE48_11765 [Streptosporangium sp. NBC_01756]
MAAGRDPEKIDAAARIQADAPGWLVMWRPWRRCFTAFECRDPRQVRIVEAGTADELRDLMQHVEVELWQTLSPAESSATRDLPLRSAR